MIIYDNTYNTLPTERKFSLEFKCHYLTNGKFPINLNPAYYYIFRKVLMIAYVIEIQNLLIFNSENNTDLSQVNKN